MSARTNRLSRSPIHWGRILKRLLTIYIPVILILFVMLLPFYWMAVTSLKPYQEMFNLKANPFFPAHPIIDHYVELFTKTKFPLWLRNTAYVAVCSTAISMVISVLAGYSLSRLRYRGSTFFGMAAFVTYLVPTTLLFIPMAEITNRLGLLGKTEALIVVYPTFLVPFCTWLLMGYFRTLPPDLEECAMMDGATRWQALWKITLPLATPGVITAGIFAFTLSWNEFIYGLVLITAEARRTIPVGVLTRLVAGDLYFWGPLMAAALIGSVPVAVLYAFFVEQYVAGLTAGAVKG
jgi:multiple sugar transport system permease protein